MANRALLGEMPTGEIGLRVSKPGFNVLNMNLAGRNVAFDSRWIGAGRLYKKGYVLLGGQGTTSTVTFGETLPTTPAVIAFAAPPAGGLGHRQIEAVSDIRRELPNAGGTAVNDALQPEVNPTIDARRDRVIFRNNTTLYTAGMRIYYIILRL